METQTMEERIAQAEMVLVGLGEEFDDACAVRDAAEFRRGRDLLQSRELNWLLPAWGAYCARRLKTDRRAALQKLAGMLKGKNFFLVSVSVGEDLKRVFDGGRTVSPCGSIERKQCGRGCGEEIWPLEKEEFDLLEELFEKLWSDGVWPEEFKGLGSCGRCHGPMVLNNVYAGQYDEKGYLEDWNRYTKWLQGTVNRRLLLLELGVSMGFPTVIRMPFEKIAAYNQKAFLYRVNEKLYQIPEELLSKGVGISENAIDWTGRL